MPSTQSVRSDGGNAGTGATLTSDIRSLWQENGSTPPEFKTLSGEHHYDVAIIGGGYTGMSAARYIAQQGLSPVILEANRIGWGASGRNGGVVSGKFRLSFAQIAARHGIETARTMHDLGLDAIDHVGALVEDYAITDAGFRPTGSLRCAHTPKALDALVTEVGWLENTLGDTACSILSADAVAEETGSPDFVGGMLNTHGGIIHPLNFARGMARGLQADGIAIFEDSPVTGIRKDPQCVRIETPEGTIIAQQVVIATNSYSDLTPVGDPVRKSIIPFRSAMIATEHLGETLEKSLLAQDRSYTETRRMMRWFRKADGRMIYGGRGAFGKSDSQAAFEALHKAMLRQFPVLSDVKISHQWSGLVAMTLDSIPHIGRLDDRVIYSVGYNGTGVALSSFMGKYVAAIVAGQSPDLGLLTAEGLKPVPFYSVREPAVRCVAGWYQFLDAIGR